MRQLTPAQRATAWYFLVVAGLFLLQGLLGGANAHYHVEPGGFYGIIGAMLVVLVAMVSYFRYRDWL